MVGGNPRILRGILTKLAKDPTSSISSTLGASINPRRTLVKEPYWKSFYDWFARAQEDEGLARGRGRPSQISPRVKWPGRRRRLFGSRWHVDVRERLRSSRCACSAGDHSILNINNSIGYPGDTTAVCAGIFCRPCFSGLSTAAPRNESLYLSPLSRGVVISHLSVPES